MAAFTCGQPSPTPGVTYWCLSATVTTSYNLALADLRAAYGLSLITVEYGGLSEPSFFQLASPAIPVSWPGSANIGAGSWVLGMCETPPCSSICVQINTLVNSEPTIPSGAQIPYIGSDGFCGRAELPAALDLCAGLGGLDQEVGAPVNALFVYVDPDDDTCHLAPLDLSVVVTAQNALNTSIAPGIPELGGELLHATTVYLHDWPLVWIGGDGADTSTVTQATAAWDVTSHANGPNEDGKFSLSPQLVTARYRSITNNVLSGLSANEVICDLYHSQVGNHTCELSMTALGTDLKFADPTDGHESHITLLNGSARLYWNASFSPGTLSTFVECRSDEIELFGYSGSTILLTAYPNTRDDATSIVNILTTASDGSLESHPVTDLSLAGTIDLDGLTDVVISTPLTNQFLRYNGSNWVNATVSLVVALDDLSDVIITTPSLNQFLRYNGTNWVNTTYTPASQALDDLTDVIITTPSTNQFLRYNGTNWVNTTVSLVTTLDDLSDVIITSVASNQFLRYNGTNWVNTTVTIVSAFDDLSDVIITSAAAGDTPIYNGSNWVNRLPIDPVATWVNDKPAASQIVLRFVAVRAFTLPSSLTGSVAKAKIAATASTVFDIRKAVSATPGSDSSIGSITFAIAGVTATFTFSSSTSFVAGDQLIIVAPSSQDATLADIAITLLPS